MLPSSGIAAEPAGELQRNRSGFAGERIPLRSAADQGDPDAITLQTLASSKAQPMMNMPKATGPLPTLIGAVTVFVAVSITDTLFEAPFAT